MLRLLLSECSRGAGTLAVRGSICNEESPGRGLQGALSPVQACSARIQNKRGLHAGLCKSLLCWIRRAALRAKGEQVLSAAAAVVPRQQDGVARQQMRIIRAAERTVLVCLEMRAVAARSRSRVLPYA